MNTKNTQHELCDGSIPENWEMPKLGTRVQLIAEGVCIDFRGLSAPAPLVGSLKALACLKDNQSLTAYYPMTPMHLFPALLEEGWQWEILQEDNNGTQIRIFKIKAHT
ncbi:MAG: DUF2249 domain-containing protein [Methylocystaceae bacterium]|nr:DUF2249 domain-containing protein [Methylocystaceae bacterium]